jgi:hypothetical protein
MVCEVAQFAYLILAHHRLHQVVRLVERLSTERSVFFIHVDRRTSDSEMRCLDPLRFRPNVHLVDRFVSRWAHFGLVRATLAGLRDAMAHESIQRVTLLSGQDYPIKPVHEIETFFDENPNSTYMEHHPLPRSDWGSRGGADRYEDIHFWAGSRHIAVPLARLGIERRPPGRRRPFQGGQYFSIDRGSCEELLVAADQRTRRFFARTHVPDEMFFQTVLMNSPAASRAVNDDLRLEIWGDGPHPRVITSADLPLLVQSDRLVAKKFDDSIDAEVLDQIDRHILRL